LISPSAYLVEALAPYGFKVHVIPNYIDLDNYPFRLRAGIGPNLLWMRTYHSLYNPAMAIKVLAQLQRTHPEVRLTMAGQDKGLLPETQALAAELGVADRVRFAGFLDLAGKQRAFAAHDIFLNTNRVDNMPVSVVEAAAFGLPIVATAVGGVPYLLAHEATGLLVEDGDIDGMARAVLRLLGDPELVRRLSFNGRQLAQRSSWPEVLPLWEHAWRDAMRD
jgi:glycosyltransferase involved in cell wall biosynthesis